METNNFRYVYLCFAVFFLLSALPSLAEQTPAVRLPARPPKAMCASTIMKNYERLNAPQRDAYMIQRVMRGNIPEFLRKLAPIALTGVDKNGQLRSLKVFVMRDYLAVGCSNDFIRVPLRPLSAQKIANALNFMMPTTKLVDEIYRQASHRLKPAPLPPSQRMMLASYIIRHDRGIKEALANVNLAEALIAGGKKDIVISSRLLLKPGRVAIYGWHTSRDEVIQPLSLVHSSQYLDYSHGVRLVARQAYLDGRLVDLSAILSDPILTVLLQDETTRAPSEQLAYR